MAGTTGIGWTDGTANFWIGCTHVGPGCGEMINGKQIGCYAEVFSNRKFNIKFGPGERRHRTKAGYENPLRWQRMHDRGQVTMRENHADVPVPRWIFCNSLSDFFDNEIPCEWRTEAWQVIRETPALRWQIVTKRVGNVAKMLPLEWGMGEDYRHVGIIATMVNQAEVDRDFDKMPILKTSFGIRWLGLSIEPQLGPINLGDCLQHLDWVICGGESKQGNHAARPFDIDWAMSLMDQCKSANVPFFMKQFGDNPHEHGKRINGVGKSNANPEKWAPHLRVQEMPRVFDADRPYEPKNPPKASATPEMPTLL